MPIQLDFTLHRLAEMAEADPTLRDAAAVEGVPTSVTSRWLGAAMVKHYHGDDGDMMLLMGAIPRAFADDDRGRLRRRRSSSSSRRPCTRRSSARIGRAATSRWSSCCATSRPTASPRTSRRAATATSCESSPDEMYGIPPERVIGSALAHRLPRDRGRQRRPVQVRDGLLRRRPDQAGPDLEPDRPAAAGRGRQLQRRPADAPVRPRPGAHRRCVCSSSTMTRTASSTTRRAPRRHSATPATATGRSSASRTTGPRSSPTPAERRRSAAEPGDGASPDAAASAE